MSTIVQNETPLALLRRIKTEGNRAAWQRFVELYTPLLFTWVRHLQVEPAAAADVVQEVFLALVRKLPSFDHDPARRFRGWLWTIVKNKVHDFHRARQRLPVFRSLPFDLEQKTDELDGLAETEFHKHLISRAVHVMQREFKEPLRKACWECVVRGRSVRDVARELSFSPEMVYRARRKVLLRLRLELREILD